jgi:GNAT superfamily N-acetyltransferase
LDKKADGRLTLSDNHSEFVLARRDDGTELSIDPARLDLGRLFEWLSIDSYWAAGRTREMIENSVAGSLVFGLYRPTAADSTAQHVGFARAVTDGVTFAWVCDVYIDPSVRGLGLGTWLMSEVVTELMDRRGIPRVVLATKDAHGLYTKAGFAELDDPARWMEIDARPTRIVTRNANRADDAPQGRA